MDFSVSCLKELSNSKLMPLMEAWYVDFRDAEYNIQAEPMDYLQYEQATL